MNCFYHHERPAVGICKQCLKGLCPECAVDLERGLACRDRCEPAVKALIQHIVLSTGLGGAMLRAHRRNLLIYGLFVCAIGFAFLYWALRDANFYSFTGVSGFIFVSFGLYLSVRALRLFTAKSP